MQVAARSQGHALGVAEVCGKVEPRTDRHDALAAAYVAEKRARLRDVFRDRPEVDIARHRLQRWISWARRCRLEPFKRLARTLTEHLDGIVRHFVSGLSNGFVESMNAQIQAAKARAKGYATTRNFITIAYLLCARLKHLPTNPWTQPATGPRTAVST